MSHAPKTLDEATLLAEAHELLWRGHYTRVMTPAEARGGDVTGGRLVCDRCPWSLDVAAKAA